MPWLKALSIRPYNGGTKQVQVLLYLCGAKLAGEAYVQD